MSDRPPLMIAVMGPTASGKTTLAERLAQRFDAQLIAADAFQVYKGLDIGTAKPENKEHYKLLDLKEPTESIAAGEWVSQAVEELNKLFALHKNAIFVGGTGFYIRALFEGFSDLAPPDPEIRAEVQRQESIGGLEALVAWLQEHHPETAQTVDLRNPVRVRRAVEKALSPKGGSLFSLPPYRRVKMALVPDTEELNKRINHRVYQMIQRGWLLEVETLTQAGVSPSSSGMRAIGYNALIEVLKGVLSEEQAIEAISVETRQYAKRQRTWIRSEPNVRVISQFGDTEEAFEEACRMIELI